MALALASGGLAAAATPYHDVPVIWCAFVPAIVAQHRVLPARLSSLGLGIAVGAYYQAYLGPGILSDTSVAWYFDLVGLWVGLVVALLTARSRRFHTASGYRWFVVLPPLAWVAIDFLRSAGPDVLAATFGNPAYSLAEHPALLQPVSVTGIHGANLLLLAANWAIARVVVGWIDARGGVLAGGSPLPWRPAIGGVAAVACAGSLWVAASVAMLDDPPRDVRVAAVQPGITVSESDELARNVAQTRQAAARGAELVVWREGGVGVDVRRQPTAGLLGRLAVDTNAHLAVGWRARTDDGLRLNEAATVAPDGRLLGSYGKSHPGTFAGDYSDHRGDYLVYETALGRLATIICYDLDFTDTARAMARRGARLVAVPSNDNEGLAELHYTHLVLRAIENRLAMVKADHAWDSAIIDPWGRILARRVSPGGSQATLVADVALFDGDTPWMRFGDWLGWLAVAGTVVVVTSTRWRARGRSRGVG